MSRISLTNIPRHRLGNEEGSTIVEMALSCFVVLAILFGMINLSLALFAYNYVSDAAREATRYAVVRGPDSCKFANVKPFPDCNLSPSSTSPDANTALTTFVQGLGYPGIDPSKLTATATYYEWSQDTNLHTSWTVACTGTDSRGNPCNSIGNAVQVTVSYDFPLSIPFWTSQKLTVNATSMQMISE